VAFRIHDAACDPQCRPKRRVRIEKIDERSRARKLELAQPLGGSRELPVDERQSVEDALGCRLGRESAVSVQTEEADLRMAFDQPGLRLRVSPQVSIGI